MLKRLLAAGGVAGVMGSAPARATDGTRPPRRPMTLRLLISAALSAALVVAPAAAAPRRESGPALPGFGGALDFEREVLGLFSAIDNNVAFCGARLQRLLVLSGRPEFDRLSAETRRRSLKALLACGEEKLARPEVTALILRLEPVADEPGLIAAVNAALIDTETNAGRPVAAGRRLLKVIENDPALVARWWEPYLSAVIRGAGEDDELFTAIVKRLPDIPWKDETSAAAARNRWALYRAEQLANEGDLRGAEEVLAKADEFDTLSTVAQDRAYASLWPKFQGAGRFDWRKGMEGELAFRKTLAETNPDSLRTALAVQRRLRILERYDEAIAYGQTLRGRIASKEELYEREAAAGPILAELAFALLDTGRFAEADAVMKEAIAAGESGDDGTAHKLDWAGRLNGLGRHAEALALLEPIGPDYVSEYGAMWLAAERVCALAKKDPARAWSYLPRLLMKQADGPDALQKALLCVDRQDEAAAYYMQRLKDPGRRLDALSAARAIRRPPSLGPFDAELYARQQAMLARPDVKTAIEEVGRRIDVPLSGTLFGWF